MEFILNKAMGSVQAVGLEAKNQDFTSLQNLYNSQTN